jgi:ABC-type glycerol-3-phosphate transport system substrate-binding protein
MGRALSSAVLAAVLGLAACGQNDTTTISTPEGNATATTSGDGNTVASTGASGQPSQTTPGSTEAAQLPDFLPLYPGAKVTTSFAAPDTTAQGGSVAFEANASPADIIAFYKQRAAAQGLREAISANNGDTMTYLATKEQMVVQVIVSKGTSATETVLSWTIPRPR